MLEENILSLFVAFCIFHSCPTNTPVHTYLTIRPPFLHAAGPLGLARKLLEADSAPFFVLNSDIICDYPFRQMLELHSAHGKEGTIVVRVT